MWYRIEFNRDGSIKDSRAVESRGSESGLVTYVDAETSSLAIKEALAWRKRYLEAARKNREERRSELTKRGMCRSCLHRKCAPGMKSCTECLRGNQEARKVPHVVRTNVAVTPTMISSVREKLIERQGRSAVSLGTVAAALRGDAIGSSAAMQVSRALKDLGHAAECTSTNPKPRGGGRYSAAETELSVLLSVREKYTRLKSSEFLAWLEAQIRDRQSRAA